MPNGAEQLMSLDEFLAWEREQPERAPSEKTDDR